MPKTDRNALEDLITLLRLTEGMPLKGVAEMERYWLGGEWDREPWGACVVIERDGLYLAVLGEKGLGLPGGKPQAGETPVECAKRELLEETGLRGYDMRALPSACADNGVLTYAFYTGRWEGSLEESGEGLPVWVHPHILVKSEKARFPKYNRWVLDLAHKIAFSDAEDALDLSSLRGEI